jgi:hypothetical protein
MTRLSLKAALVGMLFVTQACETSAPLSPSAVSRFDAPSLSSQLPSDGNGQKIVVPVAIQNTVSCGTQTLTRNIDGWIQMRVFDNGSSRNVSLDVFHRTFTFTNSAGETYAEQDVGPNRSWVENGVLMISTIGHVVGLHVGIFTVNVDTGEVTFTAGKDLDPPRLAACAKLT